jgi:hypothetical protein
MRRRVTLIVAVLHLFGTFGSPAVAYSCAESGDAGVVPYLAWSLRACCADSCREGDHDAPNTHIRRAIPCCDVDLQTAPERSRVLLPDRRSGSTEVCGDASERIDDFLVSVLVVATSPSAPEHYAPIHTLLRI